MIVRGFDKPLVLQYRKNNWRVKMQTLAECLVEAGKLPFRVKVTSGGGKYTEGHTLKIKKVGTRAEGRPHAGEITYDYFNETTNRDHTDWRHDSDAEFEVVEATAGSKLVERIKAEKKFGCYTDAVAALAKDLIELGDIDDCEELSDLS